MQWHCVRTESTPVRAEGVAPRINIVVMLALKDFRAC